MSYVRLAETNNLSNYIVLPMYNVGAQFGYDIVQMKTSISQGGGFYPQCRSNATIGSTKQKISFTIEGITDDKRVEFINGYKETGNNPMQLTIEDKMGYVINNIKSTFTDEPSIEETEPGLGNISLSIRGIN